jgi:acyl carrier protein
MDLTETSIRDILENDVGIDATGIAPGDLLSSSRIIDSFALVTLIMKIERRAGVRVAPDDVNLSNFDSIERNLAYVERVRA